MLLRVKLRLIKSVTASSCAFSCQSVELRNGNADVIFSFGGCFFFSFSSFERGLWLWGGELESWANLRLGQLPRRTQAGTALLSRPAACQGPPAADAAGPRAPGAAGTRGWGRGGPRPSSAPRLGISYRASVLVFWRLFLLPRMLRLCRTPGFSET